MASGYGYPLPPALQDCVIDNIRIGNQIGGGANGRILEAKWEGIVVAVKEIQPFFMTEVSDSEFQWFKTSFLRECEHSSRLRHPNIVRFFGIYHPPGARVPSLVMERLHCSLTSLLEENPVVPIGTKISIIKDVALGLRYLHTRNPPIIHRDLSSNNVLLSKGMEGKIGDLGTARLVDPRRQSKMTKAPGTVDFMPPEALENVINIHYSEELDVFSFGCVMLHTLSHQWPTPSQAVIINPETGLAIGGRTEVERRSRYFERIDRSRSEMLIPLIESCLSNLPKNRPSIVRVCDQLEGHLVDGKSASTNELTVSALQQEIQQKDAEIQRIGIEAQRRIEEIQQKDVEIQRKDREVQWKNAEIQRKITELQRKDSEIHWRDRDIQWRNSEIQTKNFQLQRKDIEIQNLIAGIRDKDVMLETMRYDLSRLQITNPYGEVQKKNDEIQRKDTEILRKNAELQEKIAKINWLTTELNDKDVKLKTVKQVSHNYICMCTLLKSSA